MRAQPISRREFLLAGLGWPAFLRRSAKLAGIRFRVLRHGHSSRRYLLIHGNEETARQVLIEHMRKHAGLAYLVEGRERNVRIDEALIDPNRLWSREGAHKSLDRLNAGLPAQRLRRILDRLDRERERFLRGLLPPRGGLLIALHNNSEGYSVQDEIPLSDRVSLNAREYPHEFYLCTNPTDYERLADSPFNVVLQQQAPQEDDGSLSRLAARRGVRYVNIEATLGNVSKQREMLAWVERNLPAGTGRPLSSTGKA